MGGVGLCARVDESVGGWFVHRTRFSLTTAVVQYYCSCYCCKFVFFVVATCIVVVAVIGPVRGRVRQRGAWLIGVHSRSAVFLPTKWAAKRLYVLINMNAEK